MIARGSSFLPLFVPPFLAGWISGCFMYLFLLLPIDAFSFSKTLLHTAIWTPFAMTLCLGMPQFWLCAGACLIFALNGRTQKNVSGRAAASTLLGVTVAFLSALDPTVFFDLPARQRISWDFILIMTVIGSATGVSAFAASTLLNWTRKPSAPVTAVGSKTPGPSGQSSL